jgi:ABC-type branched-subunit amino acid transport system ATPase component/ABC-type branched-subunit amino acid transport system permease subunit
MPYFAFLLLGLGNGAVFAAMALALVVAYRSSGVVNFGAGAVGLYAAYTYAFLREGKMLVPFPGVDSTISIGSPMGFVPAFVVALVVAAALGALLYLLVFRLLRTAPATTKVVASIGVMVLLQALLAVRVGNIPVQVSRILPSDVFHVGSIGVSGDRIWLAAIVILIAIVFWAGFRFTRFGLAARAVAETEKGAIVTGLSPDRIALVSWMLSSIVAGAGGILIAPIVPLSPSSYTLFIVPALAAALVGNFVAIGPAVIAGVAIGMLQSESAYLQTHFTWLPQHGLAELIPLILILVFLLARGRPLPERGALVLRSVGHAPRPRRLLLGTTSGTAVGVVLMLTTHGGYRAAVTTSFIYAIIALSTVVVTGYAGQVSLAQLPLAGAGAFMVSRLGYHMNVPFPIAPLLAALAAAVLGVVFGLPALRVRGLPVAVATLALAVVLDALWFENPSWSGGGAQAVGPIKSPRLFGLDLDVGSGAAYPRIAFSALCLVVLVGVALGVCWLRNHRIGAAMLAVRANERSAAASGINVARVKLGAFAISAFIAGLGGSLLAYQQTIASPSSYDPIVGIGLFATVYLAGITSVTGGLLAGLMAAGGILYVVLNQAISLGDWYLTITGLALILTVIQNPEGIAQVLHVSAARLRSLWPARRPDAAVLSSLTKPTLIAEQDPEIAHSPAGPPILELDSLGVHYGSVTALDSVTFAVPGAAIIGLIGANGAGKTTLIDAVSGFARSSGSVLFDGQQLDGKAPHNRARLGLARTFQGMDLYDDLSVAENILVGTEARRRGEEPDRQTSSIVLDQLCALLGLESVRERPVRQLSQGQRQLVSVARALAGQPRIVLLDEPAAGLDESESRWLAQKLRQVRATGVAMLLVDHDMDLVLDVCDQVYVLDIGRLIASGTPAQIRRDPRVAAAYLGTGTAEVAEAAG